MKIIIAVNYFLENALSQLFDRVLNMLRFYIHQGSEFARVLNISLALNMDLVWNILRLQRVIDIPAYV